MLSIKGHHVSFLKARVSRAYLKALDNATSPKLPKDATVSLMRSRAFDMKNKKDVIEVFYALAGVVDGYNKLIDDSQKDGEVVKSPSFVPLTFSHKSWRDDQVTSPMGTPISIRTR